jgi:hypothetical protein
MRFLFQRTDAALAMATATAVKGVLLEISLVTMRIGRVGFLFLVAALALDVGSPRLA